MKLTVNGHEQELPDHATVRDLVEHLGLGKAVVAVEVNLQVIPRREHTTTKLNPGDRVEVVTLVGGG
ncbi:MAG: sulfur carrier protein ThiS [Phycisphaeraceae bacterium]|nr:sulfur carrier protein ThiS [Phycisphaeraceae bacterium]